MSDTFLIEGREIGPDYPPYMIAELSANHNGNIETAFRLIEAAKLAGADAVKIQTYRADTLTIDCDKPDFQVQGGLWNGKTLYQLYEWAHTPWEWHEALFEKARDIGITIFSSPFDSTAVDLLEEMGAPAYKIASFEIVDLSLIRYVAKTGKPIILSTGMATKEEISEAVITAREHGCEQLAVLHCVSGYPAPVKDFNLKTMVDIGCSFGVVTGLSDHSLDHSVSLASIALGASIVEKHFTLDRKGGGADDSFSVEPSEYQTLCKNALEVWSALGQVSYSIKDSETSNNVFRRSIYVVQDIKAGEAFNSENIRIIRPGYGMAPKHYETIIGQRAVINLSRGEALREEHVCE